MILVLDTSVLVSILITKDTPPDRLYQAWLQGRFELVTSEVQLAEFARVLQYERLQKYIRIQTGAAEMLNMLREEAQIVGPLPDISASPDPDDNAIIATAIAGQADWLISGDKKDLLSLGEVEGVAILTVREALTRLGL